jgi:hypothetical protein
MQNLEDGSSAKVILVIMGVFRTAYSKLLRHGFSIENENKCIYGFSTTGLCNVTT